jgi:serine phosphatase RsbU (regulator of sigma subunit)
LLSKNLDEYFVLFKPKDIVSGDFYWASAVGSPVLLHAQDDKLGVQSMNSHQSTGLHTENAELFFLAVCDSTGHGVPGAFMSLLNTSFINEAITEKHIYDPAQILNHVRTRLISSISKDGQRDGMDGILLCIDKNVDVVTYAAANNNPILISENKIIDFPADKMPIGRGEKEEPFTLHTIPYKKGDMLYLYTDGYADQFGGPKGKKFKYKQLNELLMRCSKEQAGEQKKIIESGFDEWKGALEQVDDVCIIGIRLL